MNNAFCYDTNIGKLVIIDNGEAVTNIYFGAGTELKVNIFESPLIKKAYEQIDEYLRGEREIFDFKLEPKGTEFQKKVWKALEQIPFGETRSYKDIAISIGNEKASRAVGMANNKNPLPIVVPCHRVIGANGKLVGYAGGLDVKERLLELEKKNITSK
jgi:methylated-DNA-[protein]-cysteine S-methyltransferase